MSRLDHPAVRRVQAALRERGSRAEVIELAATARTAEDAARALWVAVGAIVKSLLFTIDGDPVIALIAGDRRCDTWALAEAFGRRGLVVRADADLVRQATGFVIGGVAPLAHPAPLPTAIDDSSFFPGALVHSAAAITPDSMSLVWPLLRRPTKKSL